MVERQLRALVFDDEANIRHLLELLLKRRGYEVITYGDPSLCPLQHTHDCQCEKHEQCADVIITDIDMPHVSGLDFIKDQIQKECKIRNIAIMSGRWSEATMKRAKDLGCTVFEKPVAFSAIEAWLDGCRSELPPETNLSDWFL